MLCYKYAIVFIAQNPSWNKILPNYYDVSLILKVSLRTNPLKVFVHIHYKYKTLNAYTVELNVAQQVVIKSIYREAFKKHKLKIN